MTHGDIRNDHPNTCFNDQCERDNISNHYNNEQNSELNKKVIIIVKDNHFVNKIKIITFTTSPLLKYVTSQVQ